jgi:hypothetical protein
MTRRATNQRLQAMHAAIHSQSLRLQSIDRAYATFLRTGELPDVERLAKAVLRRALFARKAAAEQLGSVAPWRNGTVPVARKPTARELVFAEAAYGIAPERKAARLLLDALVRNGNDPTDPEFIPSDFDVPERGSVSLHAFGWPDQWVKPPYEQQMERVMRQRDYLRTLPNQDDAWFQDVGVAIHGFLRHGVLPADAVFELYALTVGEMFAIHAHYFGKGGEDLLAAYAAVATATGAERSAALLHLGAMQVRAKEGRA